MADYEDGIFSNLPQRRLRADDDNTRSLFRELLGLYVPEGPLPPRPRPPGKGGPSLGVSNAPPVASASPTVTGTAAVGQTLSCDNGVWFHSPTSYAYQWLRDGATIAGATTSTYVVVSGDLGHAISCKVTATNAFGSTPATSNAVLIVAVPVNTTAPAISGTATVGSTLSCTTGAWTNLPTSYAYQWLQNGVNISGATASTYVVVTGDAGTSIRCTVTASNATASASATSNALAIAALPSAPSNAVAPVVSGTATVGSTLSCTTGTWTNSPTSYAYQWQRGGVDISGSTASTYLTVTADGGTSVSCRVAATNAGGTTSIASNALAITAGGATSVWSAADAAANAMTLSNGGLTVTPSGAAVWNTIRTTASKTSGKLYVEFANSVACTSANEIFGFASSGFDPTGILSGSNYSVAMAINGAGTLVSSGFTSIDTAAPTPITPGSGDVFMMAIDFTAGKIWLGRNNSWGGTSSPNPVTGAGPLASFVPATVGALFAAMSFNGAGTGVWTLQSTAAAQKYAPPAGFSAWDGAGAHSAQATVYLARTVGGNEGGNGENVATLIDGLVADGVWSNLDCLYVLAQQNQTDAYLNLISASYTLVPPTATFTSYKGFGNFTVGANTGFNPTTAPSPHFTPTSASEGVWSYATIFGIAVELAIDGLKNNILTDYQGNFYARLYNNTASTTTKASGLFAGDLSSTSMTAFWNGTNVATAGAGTPTITSDNFVIGSQPNSAAPTAQFLCAAFIGASLGSAGQLALYNRLRTYMTSIGVP